MAIERQEELERWSQMSLEQVWLLLVSTFRVSTKKILTVESRRATASRRPSGE